MQQRLICGYPQRALHNLAVSFGSATIVVLQFDIVRISVRAGWRLLWCGRFRKTAPVLRQCRVAILDSQRFQFGILSNFFALADLFVIAVINFIAELLRDIANTLTIDVRNFDTLVVNRHRSQTSL